MPRSTSHLSLTVLAFVALACSPSSTSSSSKAKEGCLNGSTKLDCAAKAELRQTANGKVLGNGATVDVQVGSLAVGAQLDMDFALVNTVAVATAAALRVDAIRLQYEPVAPSEIATPAFTCVDAAGTTPCADLTGKWSRVVPAGAEDAAKSLVSDLGFRIRYRHVDGKARTAKLCLDLVGDPSHAAPLCIQFVTRLGKPKLKLSPTDVLFDYVQVGKSDSRPLTLTNVGDAPLVIDRIDFTADAGFTLQVDAATHKPGNPVAFVPPLQLAPGISQPLTVGFSAVDDKQKQGSLLVQSNDTAWVGGAPVVLRANSKVPCILVAQAPAIQFGAGLVGADLARDVTITNCGAEVLTVTSVAFKPGGSSDFTLDWSGPLQKLPAMDPKLGPTAAAPISLKINESLTFQAHYSPLSVSPVDPATQAQTPSLATLLINSNAMPVEVQCQGTCVKQTCPQAKITVVEGEEVVPQTVLHFKGDQSVAPGGGSIVKYKWTVQSQPEGSKQAFVPSATFPNPTLTANAAGAYTVCLEVTDQNEQKSCEPACTTVAVLPSDQLHVELLWATPGDKDETDTGPGAGSDMDLHFAHQLAVGADADCDGVGDPWFVGGVDGFDTFWLNPTPNWGSQAASVPDNPSLDLDDTDGAGPENLNLPQPEGSAANPEFYSIGVHYWNDHGFGVSYSTVRIFILGTLAIEYKDVEMKMFDMWYVGKLNWPNAQVGAGSLPVLTTCKQSGDACLFKKDPANPKAGKMWEKSGDWCITHCYVPASIPSVPQGSAATCKP